MEGNDDGQDFDKNKLIFKVKMIDSEEDGKKYDEVKQYKAFSDRMKNEFKKDDEVKKLKDLEMKNMFSMHLKEVQHPIAKDMLNKKPTNFLRPKWGQRKTTRLGVFLSMLSGELSTGGMPRIGNLGIPTEEERK
ncbi:hypothetical protein Tco_0721416 [Tanacetum coccineum]